MLYVQNLRNISLNEIMCIHAIGIKFSSTALNSFFSRSVKNGCQMLIFFFNDDQVAKEVRPRTCFIGPVE